jgi:hypothetical protein
MLEPLLEPESVLEGIALASKDIRRTPAMSTTSYLIAFNRISTASIQVDEGEALQGSETRPH